MKKLFFILTFASIAAINGCGLDCVDKKTGMHKSSQTIEESQKNGVFQFQMSTDRMKVQVDSFRVLELKNAWVENSWMYDCIDDSPVLKKEEKQQFIIEAVYKTTLTIDTTYYSLKVDRSMSGVVLRGLLSFEYSGQDTLRLILNQLNGEQKPIDTLKFWRKSFDNQ